MSDLVDDIDLVSVRLFLSAVDLGSVTKAAARHGMTQPSATTRIATLERRLGVQLLVRSPTGSEPTEEGRLLSGWCRSLVRAASEMVEVARAAATIDAARIRLAATARLADRLVPSWAAAAPDGVRLELRIEPTAAGAAAIRDDEVDLAFVDGPGAPLGLRSAVIDRVPLVPVVGVHHPWAGRTRSISAAQLAAADLVLLPRGSGSLDVIEMALAAHAIGSVGSVIEVPSRAAARAAAIVGTGVAILAADDVEDDVRAGRLVVVPHRSFEIVQPVRIAWKGVRPAHPAARDLLDRMLADSTP